MSWAVGAAITFALMWAFLGFFFFVVLRFVITKQREHAKMRAEGEKPPFEFGL